MVGYQGLEQAGDQFDGQPAAKCATQFGVISPFECMHVIYCSISDKSTIVKI